MQKLIRHIALSLILVVFLIGCGGRDTSSLKSAILGHWVLESGKTHYYFDVASIVMQDEGRRMDLTYTVLELNETENWIKIRVKTGYEVGHDKKLVFSRDQKSLTEDAIISGKTVATGIRWNYMDSKKVP